MRRDTNPTRIDDHDVGCRQHLLLLDDGDGFNPLRTAVPFWGQTTQISNSLSPKRDCGSKGINSSPQLSSDLRRSVATFVILIPWYCIRSSIHDRGQNSLLLLMRDLVLQISPTDSGATTCDPHFLFLFCFVLFCWFFSFPSLPGSRK